jgi:hypothetical protein
MAFSKPGPDRSPGVFFWKGPDPVGDGPAYRSVVKERCDNENIFSLSLLWHFVIRETSISILLALVYKKKSRPSLEAAFLREDRMITLR